MGKRTDRQRGNVLLIVMLVLAVAGSYLALGGLSGIRDKLQRDQRPQAALAQAKQALIGFAATYRDKHADPLVFGFLPCPDTDNDGVAGPGCGAGDVSVIGRLPWKTLGLPPLRDSAGECLWYAVSGHAKDSAVNPDAAMNWDTTGQFLLVDAAGAPLTGASAHDRPLAVIIAPGGTIGGQVRPSAGGTECGGSLAISAYLDGTDPIYSGTPPAPGANSLLTLATATSISNGTNNDQAQWITADDIFNRVRPRSDFADDINTLMDDLKLCLDRAGTLPAATGSKGFDGFGGVLGYMTTPTNCSPYQVSTIPRPQKRQVLDRWHNNLLYAKPAAPVTLNGKSCNAVVLFGGARGAGQTRTTLTEMDNAANYLEGSNATAFPNGTAYTAANPSVFSSTNQGADLARCITGLPPGAISFASNFSSFTPAGNGVTLNNTDRIVTLSGAAGTTGGCFWYPNAFPIAGKQVRAFYRYTFSLPDSHAQTGSGTDRGNGFTFELVHADQVGFSPLTPAPLCGRITDMGALALNTGGNGVILALQSFIIENDVHQDSGPAINDPNGNHTAILANGNLAHSPTNGNPTAACDGTAAGCLHTPANKFEELPTPLTHNQRIEILSGCNSTCSSCNPAGHGAPNDRARIRVWVDCTDCTDMNIDFPGSPNMQRCIQLNPRLNSAYFGFTGGFRSGAAAQGVTVQDFTIVSQ